VPVGWPLVFAMASNRPLANCKEPFNLDLFVLRSFEQLEPSPCA